MENIFDIQYVFSVLLPDFETKEACQIFDFCLLLECDTK